METISLKMEGKLLKEIDTIIKNHRYSTRTEFIRDAIRNRLSDLEKEDIIKRLASFKGSLKSKKSYAEAGEIAIRKIAKQLDIKLD